MHTLARSGNGNSNNNTPESVCTRTYNNKTTTCTHTHARTLAAALHYITSMERCVWSGRLHISGPFLDAPAVADGPLAALKHARRPNRGADRVLDGTWVFGSLANARNRGSPRTNRTRSHGVRTNTGATQRTDVRTHTGWDGVSVWHDNKSAMLNVDGKCEPNALEVRSRCE